MAAINPLPSLIRASAWDAANARMRDAGRKVWNRADYNEAARAQERLVRACYGYKRDGKKSPMCFIRFAIAEQAEKQGIFTLDSDMREIYAAIEDALAAADAQAA